MKTTFRIKRERCLVAEMKEQGRCSETCEYPEYLESWAESDKKKQKLSHETFHKLEEELFNLLTLGNVRDLTTEEQKLADLLESLVGPCRPD